MYCDQSDEHKNVLNINYLMLNRFFFFYIHQIAGNYNTVGRYAYYLYRYQ